MIRNRTLASLLAILVAACGGGQESSSMPGMTAEEHARMLAGGTQGELDTLGGALRHAVHLTAEQARALGVVYDQVRRETLTKTVRTVGEILASEPRIVDVTPKIEGFVELLYVSTTGESVRREQPLLDLYSPALVAAQEEFLTARRLLSRVDSMSGDAWHSANALLESARRRLAYWDISAEQIDRLDRTGEVTKTLTLTSTVAGIVLEKSVVQGQRIMPGERLYRIADLSQVWVEGEVFEQDLPLLRANAEAHIEVAAYPGEHMMGRVSFIYPTVDVRSRTNRVRVTVPNPGQRLKPGMFATLYVDAVVGRDVIAVPTSAVVVTGERNIVFVRDTMGMLQPREVVLGSRAGDLVHVLGGIEVGETIVRSANFLVDAESRLQSTGSAMPGMQHGARDSLAGQPRPGSTEHQHD